MVYVRETWRVEACHDQEVVEGPREGWDEIDGHD